MRRPVIILLSLLLLSASMFAESGLPIIEVKADRTMIYPQRMELTGEETLMDILQMVPDLMIAGYEDVISNYNLRIDNCPLNGDTRLIISQMKAMDIAKIQVCDNTGVQKGTIGMARVLDINMKMPDALNGFVEGQGNFGKECEKLFDVKVLKVNTISVRGKMKRMGQHEGKRPDWKKAIVTIETNPKEMTYTTKGGKEVKVSKKYKDSIDLGV